MSILETILSHETVVPMKKLTDITTTEDATGVTLNMSGNTWAEHNFVLIRFTPVPVNANTYYQVRVNTGASTAYHRSLSNISDASLADLMQGLWGHPMEILLFIGNGDSTGVYGFATGYHDLHYVLTTIPLSSVSYIQFGVGSTAACKAGTKLEVWGIL